MTKLTVALQALINFAVNLLKKFTKADEVARDMSMCDNDPLDNGNMRALSWKISPNDISETTSWELHHSLFQRWVK